MSITALEYVIIVLTVQVKKLALTGLNQREISGCISPVFLGINRHCAELPVLLFRTRVCSWIWSNILFSRVILF